ncbi:hypothetical protein OPV22_029463 [Ensete ventricosum]|uniref:Uncharacterized protein n=1 Tax=Ensete ventricosum TaxID=4639 RepID=A0AAV8QBE7_ENSVE|nr:hypothetical protein OPV22_029463 [Ensete ventricosum]
MWRKLRAWAMARRREALVLEMAVWVIREPGNGIALRFEAPLDVEGRERISNVLQQANDPCDGIDLISPTRKELIGEDVIALKGRFRCKQQLKKERFASLFFFSSIRV